MQIKNGASNEILKTLANRIGQSQKGDKFLGGSTLAAANLTDLHPDPHLYDAKTLMHAQI